MMKQLLCAMVLVGLACIAMSARSNTPYRRHTSAEVEKIFRAHNVQSFASFLENWTAEAVRTTHYANDADPSAPSVFQRRLVVSVLGNSFRREKVDPLGVREEVDAFDGETASHSVSEKGVAAGETPRDYRHRKAIEVSVHTFGVIPVLRELSDLSVSMESRKPVEGLNCFDVRTSLGSWRLYTDSSNLIRRLDMGSGRIDFSDYRFVDGVRLPFFESLSIGGRVMHELSFKRIEFNGSSDPMP